MSYWKMISKMGVAVAGFALLMSSRGVIAETTTLICHVEPSQGFTEGGPTTIELNEAQSCRRTFLCNNNNRCPKRRTHPGVFDRSAVGHFYRRHDFFHCSAVSAELYDQSSDRKLCQ